jgi:hypothetical protein
MADAYAFEHEAKLRLVVGEFPELLARSCGVGYVIPITR